MYDNSSAHQPQTLIQIFEDKVLKTPNEIAIKNKVSQLSYLEIKNMVDKLFLLLTKLIKNNQNLIGVFLRKETVGMYVSTLSILKTRGMYITFNENESEEQICEVLSKANIDILITTEALYPKKFHGSIIFLDEAMGVICRSLVEGK